MITTGLKGMALQTGLYAGSLVVVLLLSLTWFGARPEQSKTLQNLQAAYNGEANAHARYLAFADRAQHKEKYGVASLFRAAAYAENIHFERFGDLIRKMGAGPVSKIEPPVVKMTAADLQAAANEGEAYERATLYPRFIKEAKVEGNAEAVRALRYTSMAEAQHFKLFKAALENLKTTGVESHPYCVCRTCGYTSKHPVKPCPGCSDPHASYVQVH